jgi:CRISPR/Cas system-associated exonuclease Cas4 (RecB family)
MIHLSASLIKDLLVCPQRAYYRVHNSDQSIQTREMAAGSVVHEVLEKKWSSEPEAFIFAAELIRKYNIKSGEDKIYRNIQNFFDLFPFTFNETDKVETYFKIPYQNSQDIFMTGKMDRIHEGTVLDWKTGERPPDNVNHDIQFIMYYLAYTSMNGKPPEDVLYVSLPMKKIYAFKPEEPILTEFVNEILPYAVSQLTNKVVHPRTGLYGYKTCQYCSFNNFCFEELNLE